MIGNKPEIDLRIQVKDRKVHLELDVSSKATKNDMGLFFLQLEKLKLDVLRKVESDLEINEEYDDGVEE